MTPLTINLSEDKLHQLQKIAQEKGITPEELLQTKINEWLTPTPDDFNQVANYVLTKNAQLYNRLA
ncbi:MAG TPA: DNA-binding protein [Cyanothece sp. UBA12306]|nr:DNA-binding protein [Cyanothece sp. UBA12306]